MVFQVLRVNFWSLQVTMLPDTMSWRICYACPGWRFFAMAFPSADCRTPTDGRATRLIVVRICLSATLWRRLLFRPAAQPFSAALRLWSQGRADRSPGWHQPTDGLASARRLLQ